MVTKLTEAQIKHMVDRFLYWRLPENFQPDAGISFEPTSNKGTPHAYRFEPSGTNLFDASQATEMVRFMVEGMPQEARVVMVKQRLPHDCSICTIAMALDRPYDEVMQTALKTESFDPVEGCRSEYAIIESFGLEQMVDFRVLHQGGDAGILNPEFFRHFSWGRRAILAVPSLNIEGGAHSVYYDGQKLFDPCALKTYTEWKQLRPSEIILFAERGPC